MCVYDCVCEREKEERKRDKVWVVKEGESVRDRVCVSERKKLSDCV